MRFSKIKSKEDSVAFEWEEAQGQVTHTHAFASAERPAPELPNSLNAFRPYVVDLLGLPESWADDLRITGISLSADDDDRRGLIVTVVKKIERAHGNPVVINTPLMRQRGEESNGGNGVFDDDVLELIDAAELAAENYVVRGERLDPSLFPPEELAAMERAEADRKDGKKKKRVKGVKLGDGQFVEAPAVTGEPLTDDLLRTLVASVGYDVPIDAVPTWTHSEREEVRKFAEQAQKDLADGNQVSRVPTILLRSATPPLIADDLSKGKAEPRKRLVHKKAKADGRGRKK